MRQKSMSKNDPAERTVRDIRRKTRKQYTAEEKIRIVVSGLRGEESIAALCRREGIAEGLYYSCTVRLTGWDQWNQRSRALRLQVGATRPRRPSD